MKQLLEAARTARDLAGYEHAVFEHFDRTIGYDIGLFVRDGGLGGATRGLGARVLETYAERHQVYAKELRPFTIATVAAGGVGVDTEFFGRRALERTAWHTELVRPLHGRHSLVAVLEFGGRPAGVLVLGRTRATAFRESDKALVREALPALAVSEMAMRGAGRTARISTLTPREREIVSYLRLGYTNDQIALACGTSFRTVRNQLSSIFRKLGVANRTEAIAHLLGA